MAANGRMMSVYTIIEKEGFDKSFWVRVGACFTNRDGSYNVFLDALPTNGRLHIRVDKAREETENATKGEEA
ncbi:MAG: hypothetical protein JRF33_24380 [Deltaproteobacteria bacterium]|nr:hypothetical protein [Deltaproteobacteria bacterium]